MRWEWVLLVVLCGFPILVGVIRIYVLLARGTLYWEEHLLQWLEDREAARFIGKTVEEYRVWKSMERARRDGIL
jgi:hypothetical protein